MIKKNTFVKKNVCKVYGEKQPAFSNFLYEDFLYLFCESKIHVSLAVHTWAANIPISPGISAEKL